MYCVFYGFKQGMDHVPSDKTRCWARFFAKQNVIKQGSIRHITLNKQGMEQFCMIKQGVKHVLLRKQNFGCTFYLKDVTFNITRPEARSFW